MLELVKVELDNFRSFSHAVFTPLGIGQGMTAINGANGAGKSSVVHGIAWALYGITPDGVPVRALRKQGSEGEVRASVTFRHDGQTIVITRALRGRNDSTIASITVDGREETTVSTRAATAWVINRLGLDAEAFLTAFVVRQKELDGLIKARPAERRKTIERLAGIERMSQALELARTNAKNSQKLLDALPAGEDIETARLNYATAVEELETLGAQLLACEEKEIEYEKQVTKARTIFSKAQKEISELNTCQHKLELAEQAKKSLERDVIRLSEESAGHEDLYRLREVVENARTTYMVADQVIKDVKAIITQAENDEGRAEQAKKELGKTRNDLKTHESSLSEQIKQLNDFASDLDDQATLAKEEIIALAQTKGALKGEWDRLKKAIDTLKDSKSTDAECPTCLQRLDDVENLITTLEASLEDVTAKGKAANDEIVSREKAVIVLEQSKTNKAKIINQKNQTEQFLKLAKEASEVAEANYARLLDIADSSSREAEIAKRNAQEANTSLPLLRQAEVDAQEALRKCETAVAALDSLVKAKIALEGSISAVGEAQAEFDIAKEAVESFDFESLETEVNEASEALKKVNEENAGIRAAHPIAVNMVKLHERNLKTAEESADKRKLAMATWERDSALATTLDEFRRDRLARLAPEISEVASDLVARMTDGKYTTLELDEDFTPILTESNGTQRPSAWLSGGEESAVALALRVAIGEILAGQRGGLLILDEVLTAQDTFRRQATMAAIRALPRQIITINHVSEATDMVDLVANVIPDGEGSSIIVDSAPSEFTGTEISDQLLDG